MKGIVHLSDTHFGTEVPPVVDALQRAVQALQPDLVVVSGDITQRARKAEFAAARAFLDQLPVPAVLVMPGNHDIPLFNVFARVLTPYRNFEKTFGARSGVWHGKGVSVIALDTTHPLRHTRGKLNIGQLSRHAAALAPQGQDDILIAAVHQPLQTSWMQDRSEVLLNTPEAAEAFSRQRVDLVLSGHVHVPIITSTRQVFPALGRHFILAGAGTAISHRIRPGAPNSFNLLRFPGHDRIHVEAYHFEDEDGDFMQKSRTCFTRDEHGWQEEN